MSEGQGKTRKELGNCCKSSGRPPTLRAAQLLTFRKPSATEIHFRLPLSRNAPLPSPTQRLRTFGKLLPDSASPSMIITITMFHGFQP